MSSILIPPGVCGRVRGSLSILVDEIFWTGTARGDAYVKFSWWGSDEVYEFFPKNLKKLPSKEVCKSEDHSNLYTFPVGTSRRLLEEYFRKWKSISFKVYKKTDKKLLGVVRIESWECILFNTKYGSYFPILDLKGNKIGDLHVVFGLKMKKKKKELLSKPDFSELEKDVFQEKSGDGKKKGLKADVLSELLNKGQELRKAMVKSVLSSCDTQDVDDVVSADVNPSTCDSVGETQREAKLVDFLMGKELSEPEKEIALNTLRCSSPCDSILEVAAAVADNMRHRECDEKRMPHVEESKPSPLTIDGRPDEKRSVYSRHSNRNFTAIEPPPSVFFENVDFRTSDSRNSSDWRKTERSANSFRITFGIMTLTALGLKKVSTSPTIRPLNNKIRPAQSPGIVFSLETVIPFSPKCKAGYLKPITISSKATGGNDVVFNEAVTQKIRPSKVSVWAKVGGCICNLPVKVYWRCLNQRLPSLLGLCLLPEDLASENFETSFQLLVQTNTKQLAATLDCTVEIGVSGIYGNELLGNGSRSKKPTESMAAQTSEGGASGASMDSEEKSCAPTKPKKQEPSIAPGSRCCTASSAHSTNFREPVETDQQLLDAIVNLNEKLSRKPTTANSKDEHWAPHSEPTEKESTLPQSPQRNLPTSAGQTSVVGLTKGDGNEGCSHQSLRRSCCCCCRGCQGNCKRKKLPRKKHRERKPASNRCSLAKNEDSTPLSYSEGGVSPRREEVPENMKGFQSATWFHSPPTKLTGKVSPNQVRRERESVNRSHEAATRNAHTMGLPGRTFKGTLQLPPERHKQDLYNFDQASTCSLSVHRFSINVYSSDAQIFYREGELEFFMVYRFPLVNPVTGKLMCPTQISTLELSGDAPPLVHHLPLKTPLSEALLSYSKHNITFHIWARAYLYEKRDFLVGQAKLPLEKLVEWEAAHVYSQRRRADHPLLPPDKHFVNLRIHPSKGELPQNLEPGRIAQLGLEIDYEKFTDADEHRMDAWPLHREEPMESPPARPFYEPSCLPREEIVTDSSERCANSYNPIQETMPWNYPPTKNRRSHAAGRNINWEPALETMSDPLESNLGRSRCVNDFDRFENARNDAKHKLRSFNEDVVNFGDSEELMLIVDDRPGPPVSHSSCVGNAPLKNPERETSKINGCWGDEKLQYQSLSRLDAANLTDFAPNQDVANRFLSPRVDRDFPSGVQVADFSSDNNSGFHPNPFEAEVVIHRPSGSTAQAARLRGSDSKLSPLPSLAKAIDSELRERRQSSPVQNLDSSFELGSDSKATQTTVNEPKSVELFAARIEVEAAINLLPSTKSDSQSHPSTRVEFNAWSKGEEVKVQSSVVNNDSNPKYNCAWSVELPAYMLYKGDAELELRVVNVEDHSVSSAFIDLTTISAGLPCLNGWYFLTSNGHKSAGQLKVTITPLESIRKYRDEWIEECRKKKLGTARCPDERISCDRAKKIMLDDNSSSKFKEKMKELEQLTERMKQKLMDVERWNESPPCALMRDVDNFAKQLIEETKGEGEPSPVFSHKPDAMPELDLETVQRFCPVEKDDPRFLPRHREDSSASFDNYLPDLSQPSRIRKPRSTLNLSSSREKFNVSDDSDGDNCVTMSLNKCHEELEQLPKNSLDAASLAIEKMIAELRNHKVDDRES